LPAGRTFALIALAQNRTEQHRGKKREMQINVI